MQRTRHSSVLSVSPDSGQKSELPLVLLLNAYAVAGALFISRAILKALEISEQYWVGRQVFRATNPFARILEILPGSSRIFTGQLSLADVTLVLGVILFPLGVLGFSGRRQ